MSNNSNSYRLFKLKSILLFSFIIVCFITILYIKPASGYELSIYNSFPWYFWMIIIFIIIISISNLYEYYISNMYLPKYFALISLLSLIFVNIIILILPLVRGYYFGGNGVSSDLWAHAGYVNQIFDSNIIGKNNIYPSLHILMFNISETADLDLRKILNFLPLMFSMLYIVFSYLLCKIISLNKKQPLFIILFFIPLLFSLFHYSMLPAFQSFVFVPLYIYLYENVKRKKENKYYILLIFLTFLIPFYHPITTFVLLLILISLIVYDVFTDIYKKFFNIDIKIKKKYVIELNLLIILFVLFTYWNIFQNRGISGFKSIILQFLSGAETTIGIEYTNYLGIANLSYFQLFKLIFIRYGAILIYAILICYILFYLIKNLISKNNENNLNHSFLKYLFLLIVITFFSFILNFVVYLTTDPIRNAFFAIMFSSIVIGLFFGNKFISKQMDYKILKNKLKFLSILSLVFLCITISIFNLYPSPISWNSNSQTTEHYISGAYWFSNARNLNQSVSSDYGINIIRIEQFQTMGSKYNKKIDKTEFFSLPSHFDFNEKNNSINDYHYILNSKLNRISYLAFPENVREKVTQFNEKDFIKIDSKLSINKIFTNDEFEVRIVNL